MGTLLVCLAILNNYAGWIPVLGQFLRAILEKPLGLTITPVDFYDSNASATSYGGTLSVRITNNDQNLKQLVKLGDAYISVKRPLVKSLRFLWSERLVIPTRAYGDPIRDQLTTVPLEGLGTLDFILEFKQDLAKGQEFGVSWKTTVVLPMVGRIRRIERPFRHTSFSRD